MFSKFELISAAFLVIAMGSGLFLLQQAVGTPAVSSDSVTESVTAQSAQAPGSGIVFVTEGGEEDEADARTDALKQAFDEEGNLKRMVIDDIKIGEGAEVQTGDTVLVHYAGTLQEGVEFDNSRKRGEPFEFTVGAGQVISGWEEGVVGMNVGGERILVVPPEKAYGEQGIGPIPPNATLVFKIELLDITNG